MTDLAIQADRLGKEYQLGAPERYRTLRESLVRAFRCGGRSGVSKRFWALHDVSFDVKQGEVVGIVGRNGAGKSTLLKVFSRITEPSAGHVDIYGRVGSLLEVGTGFHNELSGRDNIYLSGSILGMRKAEIRAKFDEIVAFSECERFLDTPVKRYSSGMYMRLAFAVAAHLEPDILVVDEVLAVGDAAFQKKCLGKMQSVAGHGRTVLFVSHNMTAVQSLCSRAILLEAGRVKMQGPTNEVLATYAADAEAAASVPLGERQDRTGDGTARITAVRLESAYPASEGAAALTTSSPMRLTLRYRADHPLRNPRFTANVCDAAGAGIYGFDSELTGGLPDELPAEGEVVLTTDALRLTAGRCYVNVEVFRGPELADAVEHALWFDVEGDDFYGRGRLPDRDWSLCTLPHRWAAAREGVNVA